jgi:hypothetical protein
VVTKRYLSALLAGLLFGLGLALSGMLNPLVVQGFLDVTGAWDPRLLLVLMGAVCVTALGYRWVFRRAGPLFEPRFRLPERRDVDMRLIAGAALFGIGWGLVGYCPGPAIASLVLPSADALVFVLAMGAGALLGSKFG